MDIMVEIHNRVNIGFAVGWSYYPIDEDYDNGELILLLGLISINIKYRKK